MNDAGAGQDVDVLLTTGEVDRMICEVYLDFRFFKIQSKRQITIHQKFYQALGLGDEAECMMQGNELIIRFVKIILLGKKRSAI